MLLFFLFFCFYLFNLIFSVTIAPISRMIPQAEVRRVFDIYFPSLFTLDKEIVDHSKFIFLANTKYKARFQEKHKYAFLKVLMNAYKNYTNNDYRFQIPESIRLRTKEYLDKSRNIKKWFDENYDKIDDDSQYIKLSDLYNKFRFSDSFNNFTKTEKRKYNKTYFYTFFEKDPYLRRFYFERKRIDNEFLRNVLVSFKMKNEF